MNLTVGPLPPAVYWRRRAVVLGVLLLAVIGVVSMCSGSGRSGAATRGATRTPSVPSPGTSPSALAPLVGDGGDSGNGGDGGGGTNPDPASPDPGGSTTPGGTQGDPQAPPAGPCGDADISLTATVTPLAKGFYLGMKVKNTSGHSCTRDVGGAPQELQVVDSRGAVVWTSNSCAVSGQTPAPDVRTFDPGIEANLPRKPFYWDGTFGRCSSGTAPGAGTYRLVAKLASKVSDPVTVIGK